MKSKSPWKFIFKYFLQGLLVLAPLSITLFILYKAFEYTDDLLRKTLDSLIGFHIPGLGLLVIFAGVTIVGVLSSTMIFRPVLSYFDRFISKAPLVKIIYTSLKDIFSAFVGKKKSFTEPVLVKIYSGTDLEKLGFVTNRDMNMLGIKGGKVAVYLPHSYNFSGNLFIVPVENVTPVDVSSTDMMRFIISAGVTGIEQ